MSYQCAVHPDSQLTHFCQSCFDLICQKCFTKQPHSGSSHTIKSIEDSANIRKNLYADYVDREVNKVRSQAQNKLSALDIQKKQIQRDRKVIEKDIKIEFEAMKSKLEDKQSQSFILKQTQIKHLQNYVHMYDDLSHSFDSIYQNPEVFLLSYKGLDHQIKKMESLRHNLANNSSKAIQLTRQYSLTLQKSCTLPQFSARNQFLNKLIVKYVEHYKEVLKKTKKSSQQELKLYKLTFNKVLSKVAQNQEAKICIFCGFPFSIEYLNEQCANNKTFKMKCAYDNPKWENIIPQSARGTKRHFWVKSESNHRKKPKLEQHQLLRRTTKKHYWNSLLELEGIKYIIDQYEIEKGKKFEDLVKANDTQKNGYISRIAFVYTMNKIYGLPSQQVQSLILLLEDEKGIKYKRLEDILGNPVEDYMKFVEQEDQIEKKKPVGPQSAFTRYKY